MLLPSGFITKISKIDSQDGELEEAWSPMSVSILLEDDLDLSRGDMIVKKDNQPQVGQDLDLMVTWLSDKPLVPNGKYVIRHNSNEARCMIKEVKYKLNVNTLHRVEDDSTIITLE